MSVWEPKVELDPLCSLGSLPAGQQGWGVMLCRMGAAGLALFGAQIPHIWLMCGEEGRVRSPCSPRIALVRVGSHGDTPASS